MDIERLKRYSAFSDKVVDSLLADTLDKRCFCSRRGTPSPPPIRYRITAAVVERHRKYAELFVRRLLASRYVLYTLADLQDAGKLAVKFDVNVVPDLLVDGTSAMDSINRLAGKFFDPKLRPRHYDVTRVQLLFFFANVANYRLSFLLLDYLCNFLPSHRYLLLEF